MLSCGFIDDFVNMVAATLEVFMTYRMMCSTIMELQERLTCRRCPTIILGNYQMRRTKQLVYINKMPLTYGSLKIKNGIIVTGN